MTVEEARDIYRQGEEEVIRYLMQAAELLSGKELQENIVTVADVQSILPPHAKNKPMQNAWTKYVLQGKSPVEAARLAGYKDRNSAYDNLKSGTMIALNKASLMRVGIDEDDPFHALKRALTAKYFVTEWVVEPEGVDEETGKVTRWMKRKIIHERDDTKAQLIAVEIYMRLQGLDVSVVQSAESRATALTTMTVNATINREGDTNVLAVVDSDMLTMSGAELRDALRQKREQRAQNMLPDAKARK